jgi:hypothetical protein
MGLRSRNLEYLPFREQRRKDALTRRLLLACPAQKESLALSKWHETGTRHTRRTRPYSHVVLERIEDDAMTKKPLEHGG